MSLAASARPATTATPLVRTAHERAAIGALLEEHRRARQDQVAALALAGPDDSDLDPGARLRVLSSAKQVLAEIDAALVRLDEGGYGFCVGCTEPILAERLLAVPYTRHCVPCA